MKNLTKMLYGKVTWSVSEMGKDSTYLTIAKKNDLQKIHTIRNS
ncbi:MAG: hypothetical protein WCS27_06435 [Victivallaceae bacterium]